MLSFFKPEPKQLLENSVNVKLADRLALSIAETAVNKAKNIDSLLLELDEAYKNKNIDTKSIADAAVEIWLFNLHLIVKATEQDFKPVWSYILAKSSEIFGALIRNLGDARNYRDEAALKSLVYLRVATLLKLPLCRSVRSDVCSKNNAIGLTMHYVLNDLDYDVSELKYIMVLEDCETKLAVEFRDVYTNYNEVMRKNIK